MGSALKPLFYSVLIGLWALLSAPVFGQVIPFLPLTVITGPGYLEAIATNVCVSNGTCVNSNDVWLTDVQASESDGRQVLTFTIAGGSNGLPYDLFATTALAGPLTNADWTWMGQGYQGVSYSLPSLTEGSVFLMLGTPVDSDGDGLTDAYELLVSHSNPNIANSINPAMLDSWAVLLGLNPFAIYDRQEYPNAPEVRLGDWEFNNTHGGQEGQWPILSQNDPLVPDWSGEAVSLESSDASSQLEYNVFEASGQTNFCCTNGTIRFWFQPNWSSGGANMPTNGGYFFGTGSGGFWNLVVLDSGTNNILQFNTGSDLYAQNYTFKTGATNGVTVTFQSNQWYQIALTYSPTNIAIYTNGVLLATGNWPPQQDSDGSFIYSTGNGVAFYPTAAEQAGGFSFGCQIGQPCAVRGLLDDLETFNYPLSSEQVAAGFPGFAGSSYNVMTDSDYDGRSDMLEVLVDGTNPGDPHSVAHCRLGYWRFDSENLMAEQGQLPLSLNDVSLVPDWSGTALDIGSDPCSQVTYWDVFTNGWANINCRQGCLRFWFKPNWTGGPSSASPFIYMGNPNPAVSQWALKANPNGEITFITGSNNVIETNLASPSLPFDSRHWMQIALNYGPAGTSLYTNGSLAATGAPVTIWPALADRNLGMVIGNSTACNSSINGEFDELETFTYQLGAGDISSNFQTVAAVDSDLDGVPDLLEDIVLPESRPYLGAPVVITGTVEAEQFDMGGPGVAYHNVAQNPASSYRPTGMFITNCNDLGEGYCLDQTRAGDWAQYTINVLVAQKYTVEARVAGIGLNGVFECEFTNGSFYTNTGPMTITTTNWTNVSAHLFLPCGTNIMRLRCLSNGSDGQHVGRFNYISVYPWWQPGFVSTTTNVVNASQLSSNNDFVDAANNAAVIQQAVNSLPATGGTVLLPAGTYYVSQNAPNETLDAFANSAVSIITNNVEIAGEGQSNTTLIAYNRATTVFFLGQAPNGIQYSCTNFTLRDLTLKAQPHLTMTNNGNGTYGTIFERGQLQPNIYTGYLTMYNGLQGANPTCNVLISNCGFYYGTYSVGIVYWVSNCLVTHCAFNVWGGTNIYTGGTDRFPTNTPNSAGYFGSVGLFCSGAPDYNVSVIENTYNGNTNLQRTNSNRFGYLTTNNSQFLAPDGFLYFESGGNYFIARNTILNNALEGIQVAGGPNAVVGNTITTLISDYSACALAAYQGGWQGAVGYDPINFSTCFIGNLVYGGRNGESSQGTVTGRPYVINFSGNELTLYPPFGQFGDYPGAVVAVQNCASINITGNTLLSGGHGAALGYNCGNALIANNNFAGATYRGIGLGPGGGTAQSATIVNNIIGQGTTFHVELPAADSFGWFLYRNQYLNAASNSVPPFLDPISSSAHVSE